MNDLIKRALIYRFFIAIPLSIIITYCFYGSFFNSLVFTLVINIISTISHYLFDKYYPINIAS